MAKRTVKINKTSISKLPNNKDVMYKIKTDGGKVNYVGVAQKGHVRARLKEHLAGGKDYVPGAKVQIEQCSSITEARKKETSVIASALTQKSSNVKSSAKAGKITRKTVRSVVKSVSNARNKK